MLWPHFWPTFRYRDSKAALPPKNRERAAFLLRHFCFSAVMLPSYKIYRWFIKRLYKYVNT